MGSKKGMRLYDCHNRPGNSQSHAFTLVEVLVVLAIMIVLASLLMPIAQSMLVRAHETSCLSNLRQLGYGMRMYADENDYSLPPYSNYVPYLEAEDPSFDPSEPLSSDQPKLLVQAVAPYIKSQNVWFCPEDRAGRHPELLYQVDHEWTSYVVRYSNAGSESSWPVSVNLDLWPNQEFALVSDSYDIPSRSGVGQTTNHADGSVNYVRGDLSAKRSDLRTSLGLTVVGH